MMRQYRPQRFRMTRVGSWDRPVGVVPVGTVAWLPEGKVIVDAWLPREIAAWRRVDGNWQPTFVASGMWRAQCRHLADGRRIVIVDRLLAAAHDDGRSEDPAEPAALRRRRVDRGFACGDTRRGGG